MIDNFSYFTGLYHMLRSINSPSDIFLYVISVIIALILLMILSFSFNFKLLKLKLYKLLTYTLCSLFALFLTLKIIIYSTVFYQTTHEFISESESLVLNQMYLDLNKNEYNFSQDELHNLFLLRQEILKDNKISRHEFRVFRHNFEEAKNKSYYHIL